MIKDQRPGTGKADKYRRSWFTTSKALSACTSWRTGTGGVLASKPTGRLAVGLFAAVLLQWATISLGEEKITVVSWGGSYAAACEQAYHKPFSAITGIGIQLEDYNGGLAQIRAQAETGNVHWDVIDMEIAQAVLACDEGLLEPARIEDLPDGSNGVPAEQDFYKDTLTECAVGNVFYSTIYAYDSTRFGRNKQPKTIEDFFDLKRFPGRRGMRRVPHVNLEFALMADGLAPEKVYAALATPEGLDRAYRKLDTIKEHVVWWEAGAQPPQMLADSEVVMTTAYNGRIFNAQALERQPFVVVWDGQLLSVGQMVIVAGTKKLELARRFLEFATNTESMAEMTRYISYSPARRSSESLISTHLETGIDMAPHMPTAARNTTRALREDWEWWSDNGDEMNERFSAWLTQ